MIIGQTWKNSQIPDDEANYLGLRNSRCQYTLQAKLTRYVFAMAGIITRQLDLGDAMHRRLALIYYLCC